MQILIGQGHVDDHVRLDLFDQRNHFTDVVGINFRGIDLARQHICDLVTFGFGATGEGNVLEYFLNLCTFVCNHLTDAAGAYNQNIGHYCLPVLGALKSCGTRAMVTRKRLWIIAEWRNRHSAGVGTDLRLAELLLEVGVSAHARSVSVQNLLTLLRGNTAFLHGTFRQLAEALE